MTRTITIFRHPSGKCHVFDAAGEGCGMGEAESLPVALTRISYLSGEDRMAIVYEAIRSARRAAFCNKEIAATIASALHDADEEDARYLADLGREP